MDTPTSPSNGSNKALWAVVAVLGVAVLGMGATLLRNQNTSAAPETTAVTTASTTAQPASAAETPLPADKNTTEKTHQTHVKTGQEATKSEAAHTPEHNVAQAPSKPLCSNCGTIESVTPVEVDGTANGAGAIAGGVLGAVAGHQVGDGNGKTLATILGAVGGGIAGNAVEKKIKKVTHYDVSVRMEDGSHRTVRQDTAAAVGSKVTVNGDSLQAR